MNRVFHTANRKRKVHLDVTRELPSITNAAPNRTKRCTGNPSIDSVCDLPGNLGQTKTSVQNRVQASPSIDNRGDINDFAIWTSDTVLVQEHLPVLVNLLPERNTSDGKFWHGRDLLETRDELADGNISRVDICRVIGPPKQGGEVIGRRSIGEEDTIQDRISIRVAYDFPNVGTLVRTQADQTGPVALPSCGDYSSDGVNFGNCGGGERRHVLKAWPGTLCPRKSRSAYWIGPWADPMAYWTLAVFPEGLAPGTAPPTHKSVLMIGNKTRSVYAVKGSTLKGMNSPSYNQNEPKVSKRWEVNTKGETDRYLLTR